MKTKRTTKTFLTAADITTRFDASAIIWVYGYDFETAQGLTDEQALNRARALFPGHCTLTLRDSFADTASPDEWSEYMASRTSAKLWNGTSASGDVDPEWCPETGYLMFQNKRVS